MADAAPPPAPAEGGELPQNTQDLTIFVRREPACAAARAREARRRRPLSPDDIAGRPRSQ